MLWLGLDFLLSGLELAPFFSGLAALLLLALLLFCLELLVEGALCFMVIWDDFDDEEVVEEGGVGLMIPNIDRFSRPGGARKFPLLRCRSKSLKIQVGLLQGKAQQLSQVLPQSLLCFLITLITQCCRDYFLL